MPMRFGSLFSGIGGLDLGLERAGMECSWQCEIDPFARRVLEKHWPDVRRHDDVRTFPPTSPEEWKVDLICGGFPCQDISRAGRRAGIDGEKSGLWTEFAGIIGDIRPRLVLVENSTSLLSRGLGRVLGDLAEIGYDAEWDCIPPAALGAPHIRDRVFVVGKRCDPIRNPVLHDALRRRHRAPEKTLCTRRGGLELSGWWSCEPGMGRVAHGVPSGVDRRRCLGNAVVPQVAEYIGRRILESVA
jgi:DNA (cytosine-5)-methyltransferase 1